MAKSIEKVKSALKLRTEPRHGVLTLRLGVKKHVLPFEVRMLSSEGYLFVHIPPSAEVLRLTDEGLQIVEDATEAEQAAQQFRKSRRRGGQGSRSKKSAEVPAELMAALSKLPAGMKVGYNADGSIKVVRARRRRKSS